MAKKVKKTTKKKAASPAKSKKRSAKAAKKTTKKKAAKKKTATKKKTKAKKAVKKKTATKTKKKKTARKTTTKKKKTTSRKRTSKEASALTAEEIEGFRRLLLEKWRELIGDVNYIENEALRKSRLDAAGDLSSMPIHMADIGTDNFEQEFALGLMDSERKIISEIAAALKRIDDGVFGICEGTGKPISKARLRANPWARYCIKYATMVEQGLVIQGEKLYEEEVDEEKGHPLDDSGEYEITEDLDEDLQNDLEDTKYDDLNDH